MCINLYQHCNKTTNKSNIYIDTNDKWYITIKDFRLNLPQETLNNDEKAYLLGGKKFLCIQCNYELSSDRCLGEHKKLWHALVDFEQNARPRDHKCGKTKCIYLIEHRKNTGETSLIDSDHNVHENIHSFRTSLVSDKRTLQLTPPQEEKKQKPNPEITNETNIVSPTETHRISDIIEMFDNTKNSDTSISFSSTTELDLTKH